MASHRPTHLPLPALTFAALLLTSGCNAIFGISEGQPRADGTGGEAGGDGAGGAGCAPAEGNGSIGILSDVDANIDNVVFLVNGGDLGSYDVDSGTTTFAIEGSDVRFCRILAEVTLAGAIAAGKTYQPVSWEVRQGAEFQDANNAFVAFGVRDLASNCDGPAATVRIWESYNDISTGEVQGVVKIESIEGSRVVLKITDVPLQPSSDSLAKGKLSISGTVRDDCFE